MLANAINLSEEQSTGQSTGQSDISLSEARILILAPFGSDGKHLSKMLTEQGFLCRVCLDTLELTKEFLVGAGMILSTDEVLSASSAASLLAALQRQPEWSAIPILAFYSESSSIDSIQKKVQHPLHSLTDVTFLQKPVSFATLLSGVRASLRDRERQYKMRDLLEKKEAEILERENFGEQQMNERVKSEIANSEAQAANQMKSQFLANMSHEIRTPLGAIMGFLELIKSATSSTKEIENYISIVDRNSVQLMRLIDDILDLSKVEAGKMEFENIEFSLGELLFNFSSLMTFKAREKGIVFELELSTPVPARIFSDPVRLRQVLTNIVGNGLKFTKYGKVQLECSFERESLSFTVTDTGHGISPEQAEHLFQPFSQADASTTRNFGGTGLGLVLSKRICQEMGGNLLLVKSSLGEGSTFVANVKAKNIQGTSMLGLNQVLKQATNSTSQSENKTLNNIRVLLVEDSPDNQALFKIRLNRLGAIVEIASNGKEGVDRALAEPFDIVLMDLQMPLMDGHEATALLRSVGFTTPIIALTAHAMKEERERSMDSGFTDFLTKPLRPETLIEAVLKYGGLKSL